MTKNEWKDKICELRDILAERLEYSYNWGQVHLKVKKTFLEIKWYDIQSDDIWDPDGKVYFKDIRIAPLNKKNLWAEVKKQKCKLEVDKKNYVDEDDVG